MVNVMHRPASSLLELIERLALYSLMSLVACCVIVVDGLTVMVTIMFRCIAVVLIGVGATAFLTGVVSMQPPVSSEYPRGSAGTAPPRIQVESLPSERALTLVSANGDARVCENLLKAV